MTRMLIIGAGNMGRAMLRGICADKSKKIQVDVLERNSERRAELEKEFSEDSRFSFLADDSGSVVYQIACMCTKPMDLRQLADWLPKKLSDETVVLSILAGVQIDEIRTQLMHKGPIVRAMPNISALVNEAATAVCTDHFSDKKAKEAAELVFSSVGEVFWTQENQMDAVTGLSGSGPAYVYVVIEALVDGAVRSGMPRNLAMNLATQTVLGAAKMVKDSGEHPAVLKDKVTTPGGTTIHALHEMESQGFRSILMNAVATATNQSALLGQKVKVK